MVSKSKQVQPVGKFVYAKLATKAGAKMSNEELATLASEQCGSNTTKGCIAWYRSKAKAAANADS